MRLLRPLLALLLVLAALGSSATVPGVRQRWARTTVTMTVGGLARSYLVVRPAGTGTSALPVMMELHGAAASPELELERSGFLTAYGPAILVYPVGVGGHWNAGACCGDTDADDVSFIAAVVKQVLGSEPRADATRVYLSGYSNGGRMAYRIACERPALFTAVAVFGAVNAESCPRPAAASMLIAVGAKDTELALSAVDTRRTVLGYLEPTVADEILAYRVANGCSTTVSHRTAGDLKTTTWTDCATGRPVMLGLYARVDHAWPLSTATTPGMASLAWEFFLSTRTTAD